MNKILKNFKWIMLPVTVLVFLMFIEAGTDRDGITSSEEGIMYAAWLLLIANVCLFAFNRKWQHLVNQWF